MNKLTKEIFKRTYQSYLSGVDIYTYKFSSSSDIMKKKYIDSITYLEKENLILIKSKLEDKVKIILTDKGIEHGNSLDL